MLATAAHAAPVQAISPDYLIVNSKAVPLNHLQDTQDRPVLELKPDIPASELTHNRKVVANAVGTISPDYLIVGSKAVPLNHIQEPQDRPVLELQPDIPLADGVFGRQTAANLRQTIAGWSPEFTAKALEILAGK